MNRGSVMHGMIVAMKIDTFNEAPIHESGK